MGWCLMHCFQGLMPAATCLTIAPWSPRSGASLLPSQAMSQLVVTPYPGSHGTPAIVKIMLRPSALDICIQLARRGAIPQACQQLSDTLLQAVTSAGCRFSTAAAAPSARPTRHHRPFFDKECQDLKWLYQHMRSQDPEVARVLRHKYSSLLRRKCRQYRQQQTHVLLREIRRRPQDVWRKLNGPPTPLPKPLQQYSQWQQNMADFCRPPPAGHPQPSTSP